MTDQHNLILTDMYTVFSSDPFREFLSGFELLTSPPDPELLHVMRFGIIDIDPLDSAAFRLTLSGPDLDRRTLVDICEDAFNLYGDGVPIYVRGQRHTLALFAACVPLERSNALEMTFEIDPFAEDP